MPAKSKKERPSLANATVPYLIDEVGDLRAKANDIKDDLAYFEEALKARLDKDKDSFKGEKYLMTRSSQSQNRLDTDVVRALLAKLHTFLDTWTPKDGEPPFNRQDLENCEKTISMMQMRFAALPTS